MAKLKLPFELEKPSANEYVTQGDQIGWDGQPLTNKIKQQIDTLGSELSELVGEEYTYNDTIIEGYTYPKLIQFHARKDVVYNLDVLLSQALTRDLYIFVCVDGTTTNLLTNYGIAHGDTTLKTTFSVTEDEDLYVSQVKAVASESANIDIKVTCDGNLEGLISEERERAEAKELQLSTDINLVKNELLSIEPYEGEAVNGYTYPKLIEFNAKKGVANKISIELESALTKDYFTIVRDYSDTQLASVAIVAGQTKNEMVYTPAEDINVYITCAKAVTEGNTNVLISVDNNSIATRVEENANACKTLQAVMTDIVENDEQRAVTTSTDLNRIAWLDKDLLPETKHFKIKCHIVSGSVSAFYAYAQTTGYVSLGRITQFDEWVDVTVPNDVASALVKFGYYIRSTDVSSNGNVLVSIKFESEFGAMKDHIEKIDEEIDDLEDATILTDSNDRLWNNSTSPIVRIDRTFNFASIFLKWGFIGDSLSSGEHNCFNDGVAAYYDAYEYSWGQYMCRMLGTEGYNFSFGGQTAKGWCNDKSGGGTTPAEDKRARTWSTAKQNPKDAYVIALGENDRNHSPYPAPHEDYNIPCGDYTTDVNYADYNANADTFAGWYAGIIQRIKSVSPRAKIFVVTLPRTREDEVDNSWNAQIRAMATIFDNVYCIDLFNYAMPFTLNSGVWNDRYRLGFHLTAAGYQYFACLISQYIDWIIRNNFNDFKVVGLSGTNFNDRASFTISGKVTHNSVGVEAALVSVISDGKKMYTESDSEGNYTVKFVPSGTYTLYVSKSGYSQYAQSLSISSNVTEDISI